jgi:hypothetical protein
MLQKPQTGRNDFEQTYVCWTYILAVSSLEKMVMRMKGEGGTKLEPPGYNSIGLAFCVIGNFMGTRCTFT